MAEVTIRVQSEQLPTHERWGRLAARRAALGLCPSCAQPVRHEAQHCDWDDDFTCETVWTDPLVELVEAAAAVTPDRKNRRSGRRL